MSASPRSAVAAVIAVIAVATLACTGIGSRGDSSSSAGESSSSAASTSAAETTTTSETSSSSSGTSSGDDTMSGELGEPCLADAECRAGSPVHLYCDFPDGLCGSGEPGTCSIANDGCGEPPPELAEPVCGCDGKTYSHPCNANSSAQSLSVAARCPTPDGFYRCGSRFCRSGLEYCRTELLAGTPPHALYTCVSLPEGCQPDPACECLAEETCKDACVATPDGELAVTCP